MSKIVIFCTWERQEAFLRGFREQCKEGKPESTWQRKSRQIIFTRVPQTEQHILLALAERRCRAYRLSEE